jgi:hypothetical protein
MARWEVFFQVSCMFSSGPALVGVVEKPNRAPQSLDRTMLVTDLPFLGTDYPCRRMSQFAASPPVDAASAVMCRPHPADRPAPKVPTATSPRPDHPARTGYPSRSLSPPSRRTSSPRTRTCGWPTPPTSAFPRRRALAQARRSSRRGSAAPKSSVEGRRLVERCPRGRA